MSTEPFIGEIKIFGFDFAPYGHFNCNGQLLSISQYTALFALLGPTYGGDGQSTFALPDLRGRAAINQGQFQGQAFYDMGDKSGATSITLSSQNLPAHNHTLHAAQVKLNANEFSGDETIPNGNYLAAANSNIYSGNGGTPNVFIAGAQLSGTTDSAGASAPFYIQNPYLVVNFCIASEGIFPPRP